MTKSERRQRERAWGASLREERKSLVFAPPERPDGSDLYLQMLAEDVAVGVMPIGGRSKRSGFKVSVKPSDEEIEGLISRGLGERYGDNRLPATLSAFIQDCARSIMTFGEETVEILTLMEGSRSEAIRCFSLVSIPPGSVHRAFGLAFQWVPRSVREVYREPALIRLPAESLLTFSPPSRLGARACRGLIAGLRQLSALAPPSVREETRMGHDSSSFDWTRYHQTQCVALGALTQSIGWNARGSFQESMLEPYFLHRELRFRRFQIELRDSILDKLNEGLRRIGHVLGFSAQLEVCGLPTVDDVDAAERDLVEGRKPFREALAILQGD
jgi:hypothetical protein